MTLWSDRLRLALACTVAIVFLLMLRCRFVPSCSYKFRGYLNSSTNTISQSQPHSTEHVINNNLTYVYVVGVEGVGHHGVVPVISLIGKACHHHVVYEHKILRGYHSSKNSSNFRSIMEASKHAKAPKNNVMIIEDASFPSGLNNRFGSHQDIKSTGHYDLEWIYNEINEIKDIKLKFLFLSRDFYRTVASHIQFDENFEKHAQLMHTYTWYIHSEYEKITQKESDLWKQIRYEWFVDLHNCTRLVYEIAAFLELSQDSCNFKHLCEKLPHFLHAPRNITVNTTEQAIAGSYNTSVPIPYLQYLP